MRWSIRRAGNDIELWCEGSWTYSPGLDGAVRSAGTASVVIPAGGPGRPQAATSWAAHRPRVAGSASGREQRRFGRVRRASTLAVGITIGEATSGSKRRRSTARLAHLSCGASWGAAALAAVGAQPRSVSLPS